MFRTITQRYLKSFILDTTRIIKDNLISRALEYDNWVIFHAGLIVYEGKSCLVIGSSGSGKTTLIMQFCALGASLVSNDRVFIKKKDGEYAHWTQSINFILDEKKDKASQLCKDISNDVKCINYKYQLIDACDLKKIII